MKVRTLKCRNCKERFTPIHNNSLQKYCLKDDCIKAMIKDTKAKSWKVRKKKMKQKLKTKQNYETDLEKLVNRFVRERDKYKPCISCGVSPPFTLSAGHYFPAGSYKNIRFDLDNIHGQCWYNCNKNKSGNLSEYKIGLIKRIGQERFNALEARRLIVKKYTIEELKELIIHYKNLLKC